MTTIRVGEIQTIPGQDEPIEVLSVDLAPAPDGRTVVKVRGRDADGQTVRITLGAVVR